MAQEELAKFIVKPESIAASINGETPAGEPLQLGDDVFIFFKMVDFEQPTLNRVKANQEVGGSILDELTTCEGQFYLGEIEAIRAEFHKHVDGLFNAIKEYRASATK